MPHHILDPLTHTHSNGFFESNGKPQFKKIPTKKTSNRYQNFSQHNIYLKNIYGKLKNVNFHPCIFNSFSRKKNMLLKLHKIQRKKWKNYDYFFHALQFTVLWKITGKPYKYGNGCLFNLPGFHAYVKLFRGFTNNLIFSIFPGKI
jgi:hypothetical protein